MYLAVDIGGTKTLLACFTEAGEIVESKRFPTPALYPDFVTRLGQEVGALEHHQFQAAGVAVPGRLDRQRGLGLAFGNRPWQNAPVQADVASIVNCPVVIENDANLAGLSEALLIINDYKKVLYITISTGIGSGYIINGKIDPDTIDAEAGQLLLEYDGRLQDWEDFASGRSFQQKFGKRVGELDDPGAWYYIARNISVGLVNLIALYTPDAIVMGGGVGMSLDKFHDRLMEELQIYNNPLLVIPPILKAKRPEEAVIYGCYELIKAQHGPVTK